MKITIECPQCLLGQDVDLYPDPNPTYDDHYLGANRTCPNCNYNIHVAICANESEIEVPF